jgi:hypothetical protein
MTDAEKQVFKIALERMKYDPDKYLAKFKASLTFARNLLGKDCIEDDGAMPYIHHYIAALEAEKERLNGQAAAN